MRSAAAVLASGVALAVAAFPVGTGAVGSQRSGVPPPPMKRLCSAPSGPNESACFALGRVWAAGRISSMFGPNGGFAPQQLQSAYNLAEAQFAGGMGATVAVVD